MPVRCGQTKPDGLRHIDTVISCITNAVFQFFSGTQAQAQRAEPPPISSRRLVDGFIRLILTSPTSSLRTVLLIVRGLLRRPSLSGTPTVTFCSVHIHNVVAKKRDASIDLLRRLHGYMQQPNVDFIGGDFNMSAFSTVGDVFSDPEFSALDNSFLCGLGALEES